MLLIVRISQSHCIIYRIKKYNTYVKLSENE